MPVVGCVLPTSNWLSYLRRVITVVAVCIDSASATAKTYLDLLSRRVRYCT